VKVSDTIPSVDFRFSPWPEILYIEEILTSVPLKSGSEILYIQQPGREALDG
jgi:hypothetical protein